MKVLLATAHGPYPPVWGENLHDLFTSRLTRGNGIFSMSSHWHPFGLHLIGENLSSPVTVLEEPRLEEFEAELRRGYDVVGLQLMSRHTPRVARMAAAVRRLAPRAKLVLGGYGVGALDDDVPSDPEGHARALREGADHFCREEGVRFMRRLLGEAEDRPVTQRSMPFAGFSMLGFKRRYMRVPVVLSAIGCPNACSFCNTSAFSRRVKTRLCEPEEAYAAMRAQGERMGAGSFLTMLFDEDVFDEPEWPRRLGALLRRDRKSWGWKWFGLASVRSLSRLDPEEVRELGCGAVWTGVESFSAADAAAGGERLPKREGDARAVVEGLSNAGVLVVASLVLGFDFQTRELAERDIDGFVRLKVPFYQISPLQPCPGTALYARMREEGRLDPAYSWEDTHLFRGDWASHPHLARGEIKELYDLAHRRLADENGPPWLGMLETFLNAAEASGRRADEYSRYQRKLYMGLVMLTRSLLAPIGRLTDSPAARRRAAALEARCRAALGPPNLLVRAMGALAHWNLARAARRGESTEPVYEPTPRWTYYNQDPAGRVLVRKGRGFWSRTRPQARFHGVFG